MSQLTKSGLRYGVSSSDKTVWVNDELVCLGRFDRFGGIDIHKDSEGQMAKNSTPCLDCEKGPADLEMWERFRAGMLKHHGVTVPQGLLRFGQSPTHAQGES